MSKPVVFFSHASADGEMLRRLKELLVDKTGGTVDVFLSSDGESIQLGHNWVSRLGDALRDSKLVFAFVTPRSEQSTWLYFEAGYAHALGVAVVPVAVGVDLSSVRPPLSLLQGFNLKSADHLNNLISRVNEAFEHQHRLSFTDDDFEELMAVGSSGGGDGLARHRDLFSVVDIQLDAEALRDGTVGAIDRFASAVADHDPRFTRSDDTNGSTFGSYGLSIHFTRDDPPDDHAAGPPGRISVCVQAAVLPFWYPFVSEFVMAAKGPGIAHPALCLRLAESTAMLHRPDEISARLLGSEVDLDGSRHLFRGLSFDHGDGALHVESESAAPVTSTDLGDLLDLLVRAGIVRTMTDTEMAHRARLREIDREDQFARQRHAEQRIWHSTHEGRP